MWFLFAFLAAFCSSLKDVFGKKAIQHVDDCVISWSWGAFALPFLFPFLFIFDLPRIQPQFWIALFIGGSLYTCSSILYIKAIKHNDLSTTVPLLTFTPIFLLLTSPLIVGEFPTLSGLIGILLIVIGSYLLHFDHRQMSYLAPFKALVHERGPRLMLAVAFIWSISSNFDKIGVQNSSPIIWAIGINAFLAISLLPLVIYSTHKGHAISAKSLFPVGFFNAMVFLFHMHALRLALVSYVIAVKRTSILLSVLWGYLIFKEKGIKERFLGAVIMVLGVLFIVLG